MSGRATRFTEESSDTPRTSAKGRSIGFAYIFGGWFDIESRAPAHLHSRLVRSRLVECPPAGNANLRIGSFGFFSTIS